MRLMLLVAAAGATLASGVFAQEDPFADAVEQRHGLMPVSYTHLTLPTNREV